MRAIKLPEPPGSAVKMPEIFDTGISNVVRRAIIIGNGGAGAEHQCIGLVRALGLGNNFTLHRVTRPKGGYNYWLRWLPVPVHQNLDAVLKHIWSDWRRVSLSYLVKGHEGEVNSVHEHFDSPMSSRGTTALRALSQEGRTTPEADAANIAAIAMEDLDREGPLLVVASGHDTVPVAAAVKKLAQDAVFVIQIQHPRCNLDQFDMVITPVHDYHTLSPAAHQEVPRAIIPWLTPRQPPDKHVVLTTGALHHADAATLRVAANTWHDVLGPLPKPLVVVNVGGPTRNCRYGEDLAWELIRALRCVIHTCGSMRITFSRRTPPQICDLLTKELSELSKVYIWDGRGPNPHLGHLAWGDSFIVTADSISMLSEACSTGKPVYVVGAERCKWKFADFQKSLKHKGVVRSLTGAEDMRETWSYPPLNDVADSAKRVREALAERGWSF
ncbi:hypothetical protein R1flu_000668 [Riccia fluitans]|uniref:Mitochondrial fission protein ELM1 n=1 Tax=Riccia fluitans TaxID=41844 RepID=A0ABD1Y1A4_9MARC